MTFQRSITLKYVPYALLLLPYFAGTLYPQSAAIDGSKTPDLIPDSTACRLVLLSLSLPLHPSPTDIAKQGYRLKRIGLTPFDSDTLTSLLTEFSSTYANWQLTFRSKSSADAIADRNGLISSFLVLVGQKLSPDGSARFKQYVQGEKTKMSIPQSI